MSEEGKDKKPQGIKGLGGITREQLVGFLREKETETSMKPEVIRELYEPESKTLITETPSRMILPKVRMRLMLAASDPERETPLIQVFLNAYEEEMISLDRQGRHELLGALQALADPSAGEHSVTLGR